MTRLHHQIIIILIIFVKNIFPVKQGTEPTIVPYDFGIDLYQKE